jgi:nucleotide-binding universal stress UspA family protein
MYKTILVPIDLSHLEHGRKTLEIAREIGGKQGRVVGLYVAPDIPSYVVAELPEGLLHKNLERALAELNPLADEVGAHSKVLAGHPPAKILEYAAEIGADLIVIASHRPGLQDYFLGSTAARVVRHAECAVLVDR